MIGQTRIIAAVILCSLALPPGAVAEDEASAARTAGLKHGCPLRIHI